MTRDAVLTEAMWARLEAVLPPVQGARGRPCTPHRPVIEGVIYRYRTGCAWRDLPAQFGPWQTVWKRHAKFSKDGTWDRVLAVLVAQAQAAGDVDWRTSVDSTISRVHQHGATAARSSSRRSSYTGGTIE